MLVRKQGHRLALQNRLVHKRVLLCNLIHKLVGDMQVLLDMQAEDTRVQMDSLEPNTWARNNPKLQLQQLWQR